MGLLDSAFPLGSPCPGRTSGSWWVVRMWLPLASWGEQLWPEILDPISPDPMVLGRQTWLGLCHSIQSNQRPPLIRTPPLCPLGLYGAREGWEEKERLNTSPMLSRDLLENCKPFCFLLPSPNMAPLQHPLQSSPQSPELRNWPQPPLHL